MVNFELKTRHKKFCTLSLKLSGTIWVLKVRSFSENTQFFVVSNLHKMVQDPSQKDKKMRFQFLHLPSPYSIFGSIGDHFKPSTKGLKSYRWKKSKFFIFKNTINGPVTSDSLTKYFLAERSGFKSKQLSSFPQQCCQFHCFIKVDNIVFFFITKFHNPVS